MSGRSGNDSQRLDKWLWQARFFKTRAIASRLCAGGKVRVNRAVVEKAHQHIQVGDVLTFPQARTIRVVRVLGLPQRRGPASEARELYQDLAEPETPATGTPAHPAIDE